MVDGAVDVSGVERASSVIASRERSRGSHGMEDMRSTCTRLRLVRIFLTYSYLILVLIPLTAVISVPEEALKDATYAELAPLFCAGTTVFDAIRHCTWAPGDICLVQGIGGLGHLAVQVRRGRIS